MTERAQPGAQGSTMRNIEIGEAAGSLTDGFIVPSSEPTFSAQRWNNLDEGQFDEFDASYSGSSLTVTIQPGEAFVKGWLATDETHDVALESSEDEQEIRLGWDADSVYSDDIHDSREEADSVLIRHEQNWPDNIPYLPIWEFETDGNGVVDSTDKRRFSPSLEVESLTFPNGNEVSGVGYSYLGVFDSGDGKPIPISDYVEQPKAVQLYFSSGSSTHDIIVNGVDDEVYYYDYQGDYDSSDISRVTESTSFTNANTTSARGVGGLFTLVDASNSIEAYYLGGGTFSGNTHGRMQRGSVNVNPIESVTVIPDRRETEAVHVWVME